MAARIHSLPPQNDADGLPGYAEHGGQPVNSLAVPVLLGHVFDLRLGEPLKLLVSHWLRLSGSRQPTRVVLPTHSDKGF